MQKPIKNVHSSLIHNSQKLKSPVGKWLNKLPHFPGIRCNNKKDQTTDACNDLMISRELC